MTEKIEKIHSYNKPENKCPRCNFFNTEQNVKRHLNSIRNENGDLCKKYQTEYNRWYYMKMR